MSKTTTASPTEATSTAANDEHPLAAALRTAIANQDGVTIGRMLELLGTIRAELEIGQPALDAIAADSKAPAGTAAAAPDGKSGPITPQAARAPR